MKKIQHRKTSDHVSKRGHQLKILSCFQLFQSTCPLAISLRSYCNSLLKLASFNGNSESNNMLSTFNRVLYVCNSQNDLKQSQRFNVHLKMGIETSDWFAYHDLEGKGQGWGLNLVFMTPCLVFCSGQPYWLIIALSSWIRLKFYGLGIFSCIPVLYSSIKVTHGYNIINCWKFPCKHCILQLRMPVIYLITNIFYT